MMTLMKAKWLRLAPLVALGFVHGLPCIAQKPIIPPTVSKIVPAGMQRGSTATFTIEGRNLSDASEVIFDAAGITAKVMEVTDVPEEIKGPRAGEDLEAQVAVGKKQTAKLEISIVKDALSGIHRFRILTPLGTTNIMPLAVGALPEVKAREKTAMESSALGQTVMLPATMVGTIGAPGDKDSFRFEGNAGEEIVFDVQASKLGSKLSSLLALSDSSGKKLAESDANDDRSDATMHFKLPEGGQYTVTITDRDRGGGMDYFYRLDAGALPYISEFFPLGVRGGMETEVSVNGENLGGIKEVKVAPPASAERWTTIPLELKINDERPLNRPRIAVGSDPEVFEREPNSTIAQAQTISLPVTINGRINHEANESAVPDEDYFRFRANKGERLNIEVAASRLGSKLDSLIEVLDARGNSIPRATIRCLNETTTTLSDRDSRTTGIRLTSTSDIHEGDYLMVGDELNQVQFVPDQPDADTILKGMDDLRLAYLGTSPDVHAINTPVYKAQILPAGAEFPSNGLPVFHLTWRNDDGGPGYGADSALEFDPPSDGEYILHLKDVRGMDGPNFPYRLTIREAIPDFRLTADPANPNIPRGGSTIVTVSVAAIRDYEGPIEIEVKGLPHGISANAATIEPGQTSTVVVLSADQDAKLDVGSGPIDFIGHGKVNGHDLKISANKEEDRLLQFASVIPPPDVVVTTDAKQVSLEPGKEVIVSLHVERRNGFKGRVPCEIQNLPPGVRVVNVGLNGVLVTEAQSSRTFTLHAEEWAKPISQPIYVVAMVESNSPTMHPSPSLLLQVAASTQAADAKQDTAKEVNRR
jgi:hypothetical protein